VELDTERLSESPSPTETDSKPDPTCPVDGLSFHEAAVQYDPFDEQYQHKDLMPFYNRIREELPIFRTESRGGYWIVSRYKDVEYVFRHPEFFSARRILFPYTEDEHRLPLNLDPPEARGYHNLLMGLFSKARVQEMEPTTTEVVQEVLATLDGTTCEFVSMFAVPVVAGSVLRNLGLSEPFVGRLLEVVKFREGGPEGIEAGLEVRRAFESDVAAWAVARRQASSTDAITRLSQSELKGRPLTDEEIGRLANMVVAGSIDTTVTLMSNCFAWLAAHPADRQKLLDNPSLFAGVPDEVIRYQHMLSNGRLVVKKTELGGQRLMPGDRVMMLLPATGRDPDVFDHPEQMKFGRSPNPHLGFGVGVHLCIGIHLARSLIHIALEQWHQPFPHNPPPPPPPPHPHTRSPTTSRPPTTHPSDSPDSSPASDDSTSTSHNYGRKMRAFQLLGAERTRLVEVDTPVPGPYEVLLEVCASSFCHSDVVHVIDPSVVPTMPLPVTMGHEIAGHVAARGVSVQGIEVGEPVAVHIMQGCGSCGRCAEGRGNLCERGFHTPGVHFDGGMADYMVCGAERLVPLDSIEMSQASALTDGGLAAFHAIDLGRRQLTTQAVALVIGVGGLGHLALQILRATSDCRIVAVDVAAAPLELALRIGADEALDESEALRELTGADGRRRVDVVYDFVGSESTLQLAATVIRPGGTVVITGRGDAQVPMTTGIRHRGGGNRIPWETTVICSASGSRDDLLGVLDLARRGLVVVSVERYGLDQAQSALDRLRRGEALGRVVVEPGYG
jgi:propanol-preferring alcohol dehydrogenase